jgi:hypothetical protein
MRGEPPEGRVLGKEAWFTKASPGDWPAAEGVIPRLRRGIPRGRREPWQGSLREARTEEGGGVRGARCSEAGASLGGDSPRQNAEGEKGK